MVVAHLRHADTYDTLWAQIGPGGAPVPERLNIGVDCLDKQDPSSHALTVVHEDWSTDTYTFGDILEASNRLANALRAEGVGPGSVVGIVREPSFETAVAMMSIFRLGAIMLPMASLFGPDALAYRIAHSQAKHLVVSAEHLPRIERAVAEDPEIMVCVVGDADPAAGRSFMAMLAGASAEFEPVDTGSEDPAFLIYTSGTTGAPKGALHAHRALCGNMTAFEAVYEFLPSDGDVVWTPADWAWIAGLMGGLISAWNFGCPVVVDGARGSFDPERALRLAAEHAVTIAMLPPTAQRMIRSSGIPNPGTRIRVVGAGGEVFGADLIEWCQEFFDCLVNEGYGQSEMNGLVGNCASVFPQRHGSLGRPLPGVVVEIQDDEGRRLDGESGHIMVDSRHPSTMLGYWRDPEATASKFSGSWLRTGDMGRMDEDGYLWFLSREDDVIKSSGYRIGPGEIEACLCTHPSVMNAGVVGVPDEIRGQVPHAFVVLTAGGAGDDALVEELRAHVRERLAVHEVPRKISFVDSLPTTATGKVIRRDLRPA